MDKRIILPDEPFSVPKPVAPEIWIPGIDDVREFNKREYGNAKHERMGKGHGVIFADGKEVGTTLQCPHCGGHFLSVKGSGHRRTFCIKCMAVTCGNVECDPCRPFAAELGILQGREL